MNEEIIMLKTFLSIFILLGFILRYVIDDEWYKMLVDTFLVITVMYFVWYQNEYCYCLAQGVINLS